MSLVKENKMNEHMTELKETLDQTAPTKNDTAEQRVQGGKDTLESELVCNNDFGFFSISADK